MRSFPNSLVSRSLQNSTAIGNTEHVQKKPGPENRFVWVLVDASITDEGDIDFIARHDWCSSEYWIEMSARGYRDKSGYLGLVDVHVYTRFEDPSTEPYALEITPHLLSYAPYTSLLTQAWLHVSEEPGHLPSAGDLDFSALREEWPDGNIVEVSKGVGAVHRNALAHGEPAQKAVQDTFNVSRSTAGRMIAKARELGFIHVKGVAGRPRKGTENGQGKT